MFEKVENVKRPLKIGERFFVPCLVKKEGFSDYEDWIDDNNKIIKRKLLITPVINHPHNDKENGQMEIHYHTDYRFVKFNENGYVKMKHSLHKFANKPRTQLGIDGELEYFILPVLNENFMVITPVGLIGKTKLKHKCIYKGKCPHRGYDLSQVPPNENGIITCPLHGLKFNLEGILIS